MALTAVVHFVKIAIKQGCKGAIIQAFSLYYTLSQINQLAGKEDLKQEQNFRLEEQSGEWIRVALHVPDH
jgi:hypothetical protein